MIRRERLFAQLDGGFVVFLIGMRINTLWKAHEWWPVARAMPRMLEELQQQPELGMLGGEMWAGRTTILVQYWRSTEHLFAYARNREAQHLPAGRAFNRAIGTTGDVVNLHNNPSVYQTRLNLGGSFFGAGATTNAAIEALIVDPRTDASSTDSIKGNTDYTGFVTSPLTLAIP